MISHEIGKLSIGESMYIENLRCADDFHPFIFLPSHAASRTGRVLVKRHLEKQRYFFLHLKLCSQRLLGYCYGT